MLPENVRIPVNQNEDHWRIWLYGESCTGKTYLADKFPNILMLNTDGNTREVTAPRFRIADQVTIVGSVEKKKLAWEVFKDIIGELETTKTTYETISLDLIEDFYEFCRLYMYKKMGISHESDSNFKAWDMVRTEFYSTIRRLFSLPYNFIMISQEDKSRDITAKNGDKITAIRPNINDKVAIKLMGMTTVCGRLVKDGSVRTIEFKSNDTVFGGSRIPIRQESILCTYEMLMGIIGTAHETTSKQEAQAQAQAESAPETPQAPMTEDAEEAPRRRRRRSAMTEQVTEEPTAEAIAEAIAEPPAEPIAEPIAEPPAESVVEYGINSDEEETAVENKDEAAEAPRPRRRRIR